VRRQLGGAIGLLSLAAFLACGPAIVMARSEESQPRPKEEAKQEGPARLGAAPTQEPDSSEVLAVAPPPFSAGMYPCSGCHDDLTPNPTPRQLARKRKDIVLRHDEQSRWCYGASHLGGGRKRGYDP
jgi:hypothetical protein